MEQQIIKKPIYKKWWMWVGGLILLFILLGSLGGNENPEVAEVVPGDNQVVETPAINNEDKEITSKRNGCNALLLLANDVQAGKVTDTQLGTRIRSIHSDLRDTSFKNVSQDLLKAFEANNLQSLQVNMLSLVALCSDFNTRGN